MIRERIFNLKEKMRIETNIKAGKLAANHNQTMTGEGKGLRVKSKVRAGKLALNHNHKIMRDTA